MVNGLCTKADIFAVVIFPMGHKFEEKLSLPFLLTFEGKNGMNVRIGLCTYLLFL